MLLTITLVLTLLVGLNFFLLFFSCNKTNKKSVVKPPKVLLSKNQVIETNQSLEGRLAPTGS
jgi:hypothetical protein